MSLPEATTAYYESQQRLTLATIVAARSAWKLMTPEFDISWNRVLRELLPLLTAAQVTASRAGSAYIPQVLDELGSKARPTASFRPSSLAGIASDGRPLETLLYGAVTRAKQASAADIGTDGDVTTMTPGLSPREALRVGGDWLEMATQTQIADAARVASQVEIVVRPQVPGYVRMLNPPSCSRCVVLAGRFYRWNQGFERHPRCDCRHIPADEDMAGDLRTNPSLYFDSLDQAAQDKTFTNAGARAIRDGGDIGQVVNARRGMSTAARGTSGRRMLVTEQVGGRGLFITREGTTRRGVASRSRTGRNMSARLMPESIYEVARDRDDAVRLLKLHGYLT